MQPTTFNVGQRVLGPHGSGTVIGFEEFSFDGFKSEVVAETNNPGDRVVIELDPGHTWAFEGQDYYAWSWCLKPL